MNGCGLGGSRVWRRAVKRAGRSRYWAKTAGMHPDNYHSPGRAWETWKMSLIDTHALLLTEVGEVIVAIVMYIYPPVGMALQAITVAMEAEEKKTLGAELFLAELASCAGNFDNCPEKYEALWYAEMTYGTTMTPGQSSELTAEAAALLSRYLRDGGEVAHVATYLRQLNLNRTSEKSQMQKAAAGVV